MLILFIIFIYIIEMKNLLYKVDNTDDSQKLIFGQEIEEELIKFEKNSLLISLVILQVLSEISNESNDKAYLLFKAFKMYFTQQEKRNIFEKNKILDKVNYYRELTNTLISKHPKIPTLETINNILFAKKLSVENLNNHKELVENLLFVNNQKTDEIYLLTSEIEILSKELRYWIHDYDHIKHSKDLKVIIQ